ncbi:UNVERIFIED_CONTAM: hypothetical protein H355_003294 [Colinus virginianus]|nr:hypothetical protein H355_003294 [Colinus virginianus]
MVKAAAWDSNNDLNFIICPPATPVPACFQKGIAPTYSSSSPLLSPPPISDEVEDEEADGKPTVSHLLPQAGAELFRQHQEILDSVLPWLHQELRAAFHTHWCSAMAAEGFILNALRDVVLCDQELMKLTWPALEYETETFIQGLIDTHRLLGLQGTGGQPCGRPWPHSLPTSDPHTGTRTLAPL